MLTPLLIGSLALIVNMLIQTAAILAIIGYLLRLLDSGRLSLSIGTDIRLMSITLLALYAGHILQFATWAALFMYLGEFSEFDSAFYHSVINFTSLGYGDIVMSEEWRLLGGLEAANGILMFGLTAGSLIAVTTRLFGRHKRVVRARDQLSDGVDTG
ncbi:ion channel [Pseudomonadota bacterium]